MKRTLSILAAAIAIGASAQETLTIEQCRELALQYNKEISAATKQTEEAQYTAKSYKGNFLPSISLNALGLYSTSDGEYNIDGGMLPVGTVDQTGQFAANGAYAYFPGLGLEYEVGVMANVGLQLEQPIYMGGKIRAAYKMAKLGEEIASTNELLTSQNVILATEQAYALLVRAKELKKVAEKYNALLIELQANVDKAYKHGYKAQNDVLKVQVKLNESELALRKADNAIRLASMNLCHYIGRPLDSQIDVSEEFPTVGDSSNNLDISSRPEMIMLEHQSTIAEQKVKLQRSDQLPQVGLMASYGYTYGFEINDSPLFDNANLAVMLNVSVPLYHFGEKSNKTRAVKAERDRINIEREHKNELMTLELSQASNNFDEAILQRQLAEKSLEQADENMRVSQKQYEAGLETLSDYLEAQALWQSAYQTLVDARFTQYINYIALQKAAGTL